MTKKSEPASSRRDFLKLAGTAAPAAVAAVAMSGKEAQADEIRAEDGRMQDTAHTRAYFESARF
ncbi:twin-arginine translocation signal domain-containing protein [Marivita sp. GX14005]|uniref:twin-arginine translocation signal domain-containing protein n=1 Tax=Marivita sp. GX14005 TaxID=2942276 RepID=UPI00201A1144|nr:twin-arginine translocation signal domain-containing protein [Marivita sp. GX14005]MCL3881064.1 twin-arginine translocation signal domain-containing protein [Marivita sp. GX14005]